MSHDEAWYKSKVVHDLRTDLYVRVQRFEDAFCVGLVDMLVTDRRDGIWLECKCHTITANGVLLPKSKITGNQIAWMSSWNGFPFPAAVMLFTDRGWLVCPIDSVLSTICTNNEAMELLEPYPVKSFKNIMKAYDRMKEWATHPILKQG